MVHCKVGASRSATIVLAFLMIKRYMTVQEAVRMVRAKREIAPNEGFLQQLCDLNDKLYYSGYFDKKPTWTDNCGVPAKSARKELWISKLLWDRQTDRQMFSFPLHVQMRITEQHIQTEDYRTTHSDWWFFLTPVRELIAYFAGNGEHDVWTNLHSSVFLWFKIMII